MRWSWCLRRFTVSSSSYKSDGAARYRHSLDFWKRSNCSSFVRAGLFGLDATFSILRIKAFSSLVGMVVIFLGKVVK
jgi:hypothetical protein